MAEPDDNLSRAIRTLREYRTTPPRTTAVDDMRDLTETLGQSPTSIAQGNSVLTEGAIERLIAAVEGTNARIARVEGFCADPFAFAEAEFRRVVASRGDLPAYFAPVEADRSLRWSAPTTLRKVFVFIGPHGVVLVECRDDGLLAASSKVFAMNDDEMAAVWSWLHGYRKAGEP